MTPQSRALLVAATASVLLYVTGTAALGSPPDVTDSPSEVLAWFADHQGTARFYTWTVTLGVLATAVALAIVSGLLPSPSRELFLIGATAFIVETAVQAWLWGALALRADTLEPEVARTLYDVASFWGPLLTGAGTIMVAAVTVLGLRREPLIPRWLALLGTVTFAEQLIESITVCGSDGFFAPGGDMNLLLGAGLMLAWLIGLFAWGVRTLARPAASPAPAS
jgi:hypothetical protein